MRRPAGRLAVAPPMISRPAMRTVTLSKLNMIALVQRNASSRSAVRDVDVRRCRKKVGDEDHHLAAFPYQSHPFAMAEPGRRPISPGEGWPGQRWRIDWIILQNQTAGWRKRSPPKALEPIWKTKTETASRVRIESVPDWA